MAKILASDDGTQHARDEVVRLVVVVDLSGDPSPIEIRKRYAEAQREALIRAHRNGELPTEYVEEMWRTLPEREPRQ